MNTRPTPFSNVLTVVGIALVAWLLFGPAGNDAPLWATVLAVVAVAAWLARTVTVALDARWPGRVFALIAIACGALSAAATDGAAVIPAAVCLLVFVADDEVSRGAGVAASLGAIALAAAGVFFVPLAIAPSGVLSIVAALVVGALGGFSRRQLRASQRQAAELREREVAAREEASRIAIARDLHDVLAHTLGGLVVQLDAADALLEAGDAASATVRVASARDLARAGLGEARRAVAALRDPRSADTADVAPAALESAIGELLDAHRALGGAVALRADGTAQVMPAATAAAVERALQEALSNARRHAPGAPVEVALCWEDGGVQLTVTNPVGPVSETGAGYGLIGMRERFAALPSGRVEAGARDGMFVVRVEAALP